MCGIVGYIGNRDAYEVLIKGLKRLEYRGYDSAGIAMYNGSKFNVYKCHGKVSDLEDHVKNEDSFHSVERKALPKFSEKEDKKPFRVS